ncbi:uncharacterized protein TNCV_1586021 [Trichonephila clavipes]|uniref:Prohormone-1 n=1 Tax=Trichonephila clavipes TaxID=2585209 RepID=A0A8X6S4D9_TRICX|nr:uncharacterized protein TNCV_1586021 [Trichonephila clavipes]
MRSTLKLTLVWMFAIIGIGWTLSDMLDLEEKHIAPFRSEVTSDEGTMKNALMYYLLSRQMFDGTRNRQLMEGQRKRSSYSKQCSFNAVSCFGKK